MKNGKSTEHDEVYSDILKSIDEAHINNIVKLFNNKYKSGTISRKWSTFICLLKKVNTKEYSDHRTMNVLSHSSK